MLKVTQVNTWTLIAEKYSKLRISFSDWNIDPLTCLKLLD